MMEESIENATSKLCNQEANNEQTIDENEERSCTASECIFSRWLKPTSVHELKFVSKDVLLIHVEKTLIFYNVKTQKEDLLTVGGNKGTPSGGDGLFLDGIECVDCCGIDLLALAEQPPLAKVVICRYPNLKVLETLIDNSNPATYKSILFLRLEYLIGLRDHPAFDLIVWAWRMKEKLLVVNTGFIQPDQSFNLLSSVTGHGDVYLSQTERDDVRCRLQLWTVFVSCKTVYTQKTRAVDVPGRARVFGSGCCWTPSGWFVFCDSAANVYRTRPAAPDPEMCVEYSDGDGDGGDSASKARDDGEPPLRRESIICPSKHGFVLCTPDRLTSYKDTKGDFTKIWTIVIDRHMLLCIVAGENDAVYGWSDEGTLLELTQKKVQVLKVYGTNVKYFTFIRPTEETVATINEKNILQVWDVSTGKFKSEMKLNGVATNLCSNPLYYYIAVSFKNGKVELLKTNPRLNDLEHITTIVLCDEEISSVHFFSDGQECIVTSFLTGQFYHISIELGDACSVIKEYHLEKQVIDVEIVDNEKSSYLVVLYNSYKNTDVAGNNIIIFDKHFKDVFELKGVQHYYTSISKRISFHVPNVINIAFTDMMSIRIHWMTIDILQAQLLELETVLVDHNLRNVKIYAWENHCVTFGHDGTYNLYEFEGDDRKWKKIVTVNCSHWQSGGLIAAQIDVDAQNILTLSHRGNFMCTSFNETCNHNIRRIHKTTTPMIKENTKTKGIGFDDGVGSSKRLTWTMINQQNELNASKVAFSQQKNQIIHDFDKIKKELLNLLEMNVNGPENTKIDIEEFDLNVDYRMWFREKCTLEREEYKQKVISDINSFKIETEDILKKHWKSLFVKPKSIHCLKRLYKVDNYPISITDQKIIERANEIIERRADKKGEDENLSFGGKTSAELTDTFEMIDDESLLSENDCKQSNDKCLKGSIGHRFGVTVKHLNSQYDYYKLEMAEDEIVLLQYMVNKLKHNFNKLFDNLFVEKQRQLINLNGYNDRLRVIETEFRLACKIEPTEPSPVDYEWNEYEQTEKLILVKDDEVPVKPHRILSGEEKLIDANSAKEGHNSQLLAYDNFRQRALISMMDGVLEKRWEDELKKDVPKPRCMLKKTPDDYTEEDLKAVSDYEKLSIALSDERMKYKKILEEEKTKIIMKIEESINEFDNSVFELFKIKLKYNSAINHENLKIVKLSKMLSDSERRKQRIEQYRKTNLEIEKNLAQTVKKITKTEATHGNLLNTIETLKHKNNILNKRFKSEFPSRLIYEQALIAYNRRPKLQGNTNYSPLLGYQFFNTIMDPSDDKLELLCSEFVKYLDTLRVYDDYKYVEDYKLNMDRETWHTVCNFRRMKIESEFKISTYQKDATDKANLLDNLIHDKEDKETMIEQYKSSIISLENQDLCYRDDPEIQLVINQGHIEIELTGHFSDFDNTLLVSKNSIDEVNDKIKETGKIKIEVLSDLLKFKRKCRFLKWEYDILKKHKITLYKYRFDVITSMKVTENMLHYLKFKGKGINIAKQAEQKVDKELAAIQITYSKEKTDLERKLNELGDKIRSVTRENEKVDKNIDQLNHNLIELKNKIDSGLTNKLKLFSDLRMKDIVKRAQMITGIQELHKEVFVLQTELELLLLKTFPTLYTIPKNTSIRR